MADPGADVDRAAILARRRRFVIMALGGLTGVSGCARQPSATSLSLAVAPGCASTEPPPEPAASTTPKLCPVPHVNSSRPGDRAENSSELDEAGKRERAEQLIERAEQARAAGDPKCATALLEEAYYLTPDQHRMALRVGEAAFAAQLCEKASDYLKHFLAYANPETPEQDFARAKELLIQTAELECWVPFELPREPSGDPHPCLSVGLPVEPRERPPALEPSRRELREAQRAAERAARITSECQRPKRPR